ncbi:MAG: hypothetical protein HW421_800 [Ignavibacteria bacterium]|nr:hypothetical protein [Ignavibacteria bacterium]
MKKSLKILLVIISVAITFSCASLTYSPSLNLPDKIQKDETKVAAAYELLPLTNDNEDGDDIVHGMFVSIQHSYSSRFCMQAKYWAEINSFKAGKDYNHGAALTSYILLNDTNAVNKFYLAPTIGMSLIENKIDMGTIGSWIAMQTQKYSVFEPYAALGIIYGNTNFDRNEWGLGLIPNVGTNISIFNNLMLNIEISFPQLINSDFEFVRYYFCPTVGFSYGI